MVYYRKYRPQKVSELDLSAVRARLTSILSAKELPHAFLFTGPKGLGKTSSARILAKAINCEKQVASRSSHVEKKTKSEEQNANGGSIEPCNKCDACVSITNGSNLDVLEIDAASNRGIDEIRDLREKVKFAPSNLSRKVYIIDEVHMLTTDAFNALLKTLEEPPSHVVFVLCTTEAEKVPATVASRTFHVEFHKPTSAEIVSSLERVVKGEKLDVEKEVLGEIYKLSEGSFRDAAKILEDLAISSGNKRITKETLESIYRTAGLDLEVIKLLTALSTKDIAEALSTIDNLAEKGTDFKVLTEKLAETLHDILMLRAGREVTASDIKEFTTGDLKTLLGFVNDSYKNIKLSVLPQIPLELVVVGWCLENQIQNSKIKNQKSEEQEEQIVNRTSPVVEQTNEENKQIVQRTSHVERKEKDRTTTDERQPTSSHGALFDTSKSQNFVAALLSSVKRDNHSIAGILRGCHLVEMNPGNVLFETKYKFHKDRLNDPKVATILDRRATELLREDTRIVVKLVEK